MSHETGSRQVLLRVLLELDANKYVLLSPQPTQTSALEFQNSMIPGAKDIYSEWTATT